MMVYGEQKYRFVSVDDPPTPYGVGLDDGEDDYWLTFEEGRQRSSKVFMRRHLPMGKDGPLSPWVLLDNSQNPELDFVARHLATLRVNTSGEVWGDHPYLGPEYGDDLPGSDFERFMSIGD